VEHRVELRMKYSGTATFGQTLRAGAPSGGISTVTPWISGTDSPATIVGRCTEPAGVASGGSGLVLLSV
jgi:hypothetical protein